MVAKAKAKPTQAKRALIACDDADPTSVCMIILLSFTFFARKHFSNHFCGPDVAQYLSIELLS